ncbi:hypothetical protein UFOVP190_89 [uncultured Caudovirales phage]|uniref:Uncharacterized protein n=1 Tax=uncultured Caudovirales phage TaxID=2100421 RepID=A0A6J7WG57_9CAUD|nr:hypothetical protein UFOVP190_89 [uncultured Caudovirales phage]
MAFPTSPTNGQTANVNGITYTFSSTDNAWTRVVGVLANVTAGNVITVNGIYWSNGAAYSSGSSGSGSGTAIGNNSIITNNQSITANATLGPGTNGFSIGPVNTAPGVTVTVTNGQRWVII